MGCRHSLQGTGLGEDLVQIVDLAIVHPVNDRYRTRLADSE